jgi:hypothetical protein
MNRRKYVRWRRRFRLLIQSRVGLLLIFLSTTVLGCIVEDIWHFLIELIWKWLKSILW